MKDTSRRESQLTSLEAEIQQERAAALGVAGRRLEESLARYHSPEVDDPERRAEVLDAVAHDLWLLLIQRDSMAPGSGDVDRIAEEYGVPEAAKARVGVVRAPKTRG